MEQNMRMDHFDLYKKEVIKACPVCPDCPEVSRNKKVIETRDQTMCPMCPTDIEKLRLNRGLVLLFKYI